MCACVYVCVCLCVCVCVRVCVYACVRDACLVAGVRAELAAAAVGVRVDA